jgi:hypothetical protein
MATATASATYFYLDLRDPKATDVSHERRWRTREVSSSGPASWQWAPRPL